MCMKYEGGAGMVCAPLYGTSCSNKELFCFQAHVIHTIDPDASCSDSPGKWQQKRGQVQKGKCYKKMLKNKCHKRKIMANCARTCKLC